MIYGIGTDILRVSRVARVHARHGERFAARILHPSESAGLDGSGSPARHLAKCFAVKEAFAKALGTGMRGFAHAEVGCARVELGRPTLVFSERLLQALSARGIVRSHVSLSDDGDWVCAFVVLETA